MPIIDVSIVVGRDAPIAGDLAQSLANAIGVALLSPPGETWLRLHVLPEDRYAENNGPVRPTELPVFVVLLARVIPEPAQFADSVNIINGVVSEVTGRARENVAR